MIKDHLLLTTSDRMGRMKTVMRFPKYGITFTMNNKPSSRARWCVIWRCVVLHVNTGQQPILKCSSQETEGADWTWISYWEVKRGEWRPFILCSPNRGWSWWWAVAAWALLCNMSHLTWFVLLSHSRPNMFKFIGRLLNLANFNV